MNRLRVLLGMRALFGRLATLSKGSLAAVCLFFLGSMISAQAVVWNKDVTEAEVLEIARPMTSVVNIEVFGAEGSGVLLPSGKHVLTAKHVVLNPIIGLVMDFVSNKISYDEPAARVYVTMEDEAGRKTKTMAKGVYFHPSSADIAIIELSHPVSQLLDEDGNCPSIIPSPLYRENPQHLCGERLYGAGYGDYGMELDDKEKHASGDRRYYETFFNFVLDANCFPCVGDDPSHLAATIEDVIGNIEDLERRLNEDPENTHDLSFLAQYQEQLSYLLNKSFEIRVDERLRDEATFIGLPLSGDSGSAIFDEEGQVVAVVTRITLREGGLLEHSSSGELVYSFLDWIDDVTEGREEGMIIFGLLDAPVGLGVEVFTASLLSYALHSVVAEAYPSWGLYYALVHTYFMDDTGLVELMIKALFYENLFSDLERGAYLDFSLLLAFSYLF